MVWLTDVDDDTVKTKVTTWQTLVRLRLKRAPAVRNIIHNGGDFGGGWRERHFTVVALKPEFFQIDPRTKLSI